MSRNDKMKASNSKLISKKSLAQLALTAALFGTPTVYGWAQQDSLPHSLAVHSQSDSLVLPSKMGWGRDKQGMDLAACLDFASKEASRVQLSQADYAASQARYRRAIGRLLPTVSLSADAYFNFGRGLDAATNTYTDVNSFRSNYSASLQWTLFDGLASWHGLAAARSQKRADAIGRENAVAESKLSSMEAYYDMVYAYYMHELAAEKAAESKQVLERVREMESLGMKSLPELYEAEAIYYEEAERSLLAANSYELTLLNLGKSINWPLDKPLKIRFDDEESLEFNPAEAVESEQETNMQHPRLLMAASKERIAQLELKASLAAFMPSLSLQAGFSTGFSRFIDGSTYEAFATQLKHRRGHYVGLNLSIPLFTGLRASSQRSEARAQAYRARIERESSIQEFAIEQRKIESELAIASARYQQVQKRSEAAAYAYKAAQRRYDEGLISLIDLAQLKNKNFEAESAKLRMLLTQELNKAKLHYYYQNAAR